MPPLSIMILTPVTILLMVLLAMATDIVVRHKQISQPAKIFIGILSIAIELIMLNTVIINTIRLWVTP